ncbi:MAG: metalloregulator ArsR/SmtB family transcription factor [Verrucomicrobiales bacterium]|nr:metalloregulator ArsR/SmtB family transcription factor [Verrucomicrobiales bacterium]
MEDVAANRASFEVIADLFKVFSDATRLSILQSLKAGPLTVGQLVEHLGMTQANISKHLKILADARILRRTKEGTSVYYEIDDDFIFPLCEIVCDKLVRDSQAKVPFDFSI